MAKNILEILRMINVMVKVFINLETKENMKVAGYEENNTGKDFIRIGIALTGKEFGKMENEFDGLIKNENTPQTTFQLIRNRNNKGACNPKYKTEPLHPGWSGPLYDCINDDKKYDSRIKHCTSRSLGSTVYFKSICCK